jgi:ribonuclease HI
LARTGASSLPLKTPVSRVCSSIQRTIERRETTRSTSEITRTPEYVGLVYRPKEGPNKIFYIGVIRALEEILETQYVKYLLKVRGDCQPVIDQLNGKWRAVEMKTLYDQVKSLEKKIMKEKRAQIEYEYLAEDDHLYNKIDQCVKQFREFIKQRVF